MIKIENNRIFSDDSTKVIRHKNTLMVFKEATTCKNDTIDDFEEITEEQNQKEIEIFLKTL